MPDELDTAWGRLLDLERELASAVGAELVEMCQARVATLLDHQDEMLVINADVVSQRLVDLTHWPTSTAFTDDERAHLALAEQLVIDGSGVDDPLVDALAAHRSPGEIYTFVRWVQATEARQRAQLLLRHHVRSDRFR